MYGLLINDALPKNAITTIMMLAEYLKQYDYPTSIVRKWHLGHKPKFLPTRQRFNEWLGIPFPISGVSIDYHVCFFGDNKMMWLPLYQKEVKLFNNLSKCRIWPKHIQHNPNNLFKGRCKPSFLFALHGLLPNLLICQWRGKAALTSTFADAVKEIDNIVRQILRALDETSTTNNTLIFVYQ